MNKYTILTNKKNWIETNAINQLKSVSEYKGVIKAFGLPDLHAGITPVGASIILKDFIYPYLIGGDIGCGMSLFNTKIPIKKFKQEKWVNRLNYIKELSYIETKNIFDEQSPIFDLGTLGGGNHFAEFQKIDKIFNKEEFEKLNIKDDILLLIHSGSRGYGQHIANQFRNEKGYEANSEEAILYFKLHDDAILWGFRNRLTVANKLIAWLGFGKIVDLLINCCHNYIEKKGEIFIFRKGAVSATDGLIVLPGSRGTLTYIIKPIGDSTKSGYSLSHGAGRKWPRSICKSRIDNKYNRNTIRQTDLKSRVVCHDTELLYKEAPEAYKNINDILSVLKEYELIEIIATLKPLITFKG